MKTIKKIIRYEIHDLLRSKWLLIYTVFFWLITDLLFRFGGGDARVVISLMNIVLILIPLIALVFGMIYLYNSREFIELLLTQPINRPQLFLGMYLGLALPICLAFIAGMVLPLLYLSGFDGKTGISFFYLVLTGSILNFIFTALAFYFSTGFEDRIKGLGIAVLSWLFFVVLYDGLIMVLLFLFADYPLDNFSIAISLFNPIDLGRIFMLLNLDISALMGYTGAAFSHFFGSSLGISVALTCMLAWIALPLFAGERRFRFKDF